MIANNEVTAENIGACERVQFSLPDGGGIVMLCGPQGVGKSTLIAATRNVVNGKGDKIPVRDGTKSGRIDAFGTTLKIGSKATRTGELEVNSIESRLTLVDLVDPGIKSPEAADSHRIKSLVQLAGVKDDPALFYDLFGGRAEYEAIVPPGEHGDVVTLAGVVKRAAESKARDAEAQYQREAAASNAKLQGTKGIDLDAPSDDRELSAALEAAVRADVALKERDEMARSLLDQAATGREILAEAEASYDGPTVEAARAIVETQRATVTKHEEKVKRLQEELAAATEQLREHSHTLRRDEATLVASKQHFATMDGWRKAIEAGAHVKPIDPAELAASAAAVAEARKAVGQGAIIRKALQELADSEVHAAAAVSHNKRADQLRQAAKGTDEVLSSCVAKVGSKLRVEAGRLVLTTDRGTEYFAELSHGERWRIALDIAIDAADGEAVIPVPQEAWEGVDIFNRKEIHAHLRERNSWIITGQASREESETTLRAVAFAG